MPVTCAEKSLIVALDFDDPRHAYEFCQRLALPDVIYKIGLGLLFAGGPDLVRRLTSENYKVFVDAKLLDIENTVERATAKIAELGATFLTIHAQDPHTLAAAKRGAGASGLKLLAVTVLTNVGAHSLSAMGYAKDAADLVSLRASFAADAGFFGVVSSPREAALLKKQHGNSLAIVTPGIRLGDGTTVTKDDQVRTATPHEAIKAGADYIVVGRPIIDAADPVLAARSIIEEMAAAE